MHWHQIIWDPTDGGNVEHVQANDLTTHDVEFVLKHSLFTDRSRTTGSPCVFGYVPDGRFVIVVYQVIDLDTVMPITAYEVPEP